MRKIFTTKNLMFATHIALICFLFSCNKTSEKKEIEQKPLPIVSADTIKTQTTDRDNSAMKLDEQRYVILESLPDWVNASEIISDFKIKDKYLLDPRLNPFYLEEDFNGDGILDLALPVKEISSGKLGFAIIHGGKNEIFIVGAGKLIKNGLDDDQSYIDVWKVNREKENLGTDLDDNGDLIESQPLLLEHTSINILKTELGGGIIFWNGKEYEYLHQTC